jgi:hypothetical protein
MRQTHLTTERLLAIRDGESDDRRELEHLISCPECQATFDDSRWLYLLAKLRPAKRQAGPHIEGDTLLAYHMRALSQNRVENIREHLAGCRACLVAYGRSRAASRRNHYSSPSPGALSDVMQRFRPRRMQRLGSLLVRALGDGIRVSFEAEPGAVQAPARFGETLRGIAQRHPSSARRRIQRLKDQEAFFDSLEVHEAAAPAMGEASMESEGSSILGLPWGLRVTPVQGASDLRVTLTPIATDRSVRGVEVRIVSDQGTESRATTDARGSAVLPCPPGSSRLIIEVDPPLVVQVEFDG